MRYTVLLASLLLCACSPEPADNHEDSSLRDAAQAPLDKAEAVEETILESKQRIDDAVDESDD